MVEGLVVKVREGDPIHALGPSLTSDEDANVIAIVTN